MISVIHSHVIRAITLLITIFSLSLPAYAKYSGGTGEPHDPYQIETFEDLMLLGETPEDYDKHFILTVDIDLDPNLPGRKVFDRAVIASDMNFHGTTFTGVFDGRGHTISNLTIEGESFLGLFGHLDSEATILDLGLEAVDVNGSHHYIGSLVGYSSGNITSSYSTGKVTGDNEVGGLVGESRIYSRITNCYSTCSVTGNFAVGGLVGFNYESCIKMSFSTSTVTGVSSVGGLAGYNTGSIVTSCSTGAVNGDSDVGGLVGKNGMNESTRDEPSPGNIADCYSAGMVTGNKMAGGLVGHHEEGDITMSFITGAVMGDEYVGGLVGYTLVSEWNDATTTASFWDVETSGQMTSDGGIGKTTTEMHDPNTFIAAGWEFSPLDVWVEPEGGGYPIFWWQIESNYGLPDFSGGTGEPNDPYLISTADELNSIGHHPRLMMRHFKLIDNLDLKDIHFYPIGSPDYPYLGVFDGNGYVISNITIDGEGYLGFFNFLGYGAEVRELGLVDVNISGTGSISHVGGLVGYSEGNITNCYCTGKVYGNGILTVANIPSVGGLVGCNRGNISESQSSVMVSGESFLFFGSISTAGGFGGLVGYNYGSITASYSTGTVSGLFKVGGLAGDNGGSITTSHSRCTVTGNNSVGGLVGSNHGSIIASYSTGSVNGDSYIGGLVGDNDYEGSIVESYSSGTVIGERKVGGIAGQNNGSIDMSFSSETVVGEIEVGGLIGENHNGIIVTSYSTGSVSGGDDVGGLVGDNSDVGSIVESYSTGTVSGNNGVGGLVGSNDDSSIVASYSTGTVSGTFDVGGLAGWTRGGSINGSYSTGRVSGIDYVGGLVGCLWQTGSGSITKSFWDIQTSSQPTSDGGMGLTTAEMQTAVTFLNAGWDFIDETANGTEDTWKIAEGIGYPCLSWQKYSGGTGDPNDPYQIATAEDLIALGESHEDYEKHFILTAEIDLDPNLPGRKVFDRAIIAPDTNDTRDWFQGDSFTGIFDGSSYKISHLTILGKSYLGLFGEVGDEAVISNLGMEAVDVDGTGIALGGLAGRNFGSIANCYITGTVNGEGGVGGLIGDNVGDISNCYSTATISGDSCVGGLVGFNTYGIPYRGRITKCYSDSNVFGTDYVGGIVGTNHASIADCYSIGAVCGFESVGGLVGWNGYAGLVMYCYSIGRVEGNELFGGLVGCDVGMGGGPGQTTNSFWDIETSDQQTSAGGTGLTTIEMQIATTFLKAGWDFVDEVANGTEDIWRLDEGNDYPRLWWELIPEN